MRYHRSASQALLQDRRALLWTEFYECMNHGHAAASVTDLQLMSAAVHLDAAWSQRLGEKVGVK